MFQVRATLTFASALIVLMIPGALGGVQGPSGLVGPFAGVAQQGDDHSYLYNNNPGGFDCIALARPYQVVLSYTPPTDTLTLTIGNGYYTATGSNGMAVINFWAGVCAAFTIHVHGTSVTAAAPYAVEVHNWVAAGLPDPSLVCSIC